MLKRYPFRILLGLSFCFVALSPAEAEFSLSIPDEVTGEFGKTVSVAIQLSSSELVSAGNITIEYPSRFLRYETLRISEETGVSITNINRSLIPGKGGDIDASILVQFTSGMNPLSGDSIQLIWIDFRVVDLSEGPVGIYFSDIPERLMLALVSGGTVGPDEIQFNHGSVAILPLFEPNIIAVEVEPTEGVTPLSVSLEAKVEGTVSKSYWELPGNIRKNGLSTDYIFTESGVYLIEFHVEGPLGSKQETIRVVAHDPSAVLDLSADHFSFGTVATDSSGSDFLFIRNRGELPLEVELELLESGGAFLISGDTVLVDSGGVTAVEITFEPSDAGDFEASLLVHSNDPTHLEQILFLSGTGLVTEMVCVDNSGAVVTCDFNGDRMVDFGDFFLFVDQFGKEWGIGDWNGSFDVDGNRMVDFGDFFLFVDQFGKVCTLRPASR